MPRIKNLIGNKYQKLLVIELFGKNSTGTLWKCLCDCGNIKVTAGVLLKLGKSVFCGCKRRGKISENKYKIFGEVTIFYIKDKEVLIDTDDLERLIKYKWFIHCEQKETENRKECLTVTINIGFVDSKLKHLKMHRIIMNLDNPKIQVDHINRNRLDNRKLNLRLTDAEGNSKNKGMRKDNKTGYIGVSCYKKSKKWKATIVSRKKQYHLGFYDNIEDAANAYRNANLKLNGEFSPFFEKKIS